MFGATGSVCPWATTFTRPSGKLDGACFSSHAFTAIEGKALTVTATAFEKGGVTTPLEQRPTIEWHEKIMPLTAAVAATPAVGAPVDATPSTGGGKK